MFRYLPEQASEIAPKIDWVNNLITDLSVFFTAAVVGAMLYFAIRYRRREDNQETPAILGSHFLEILWTVVPTVISAFVAYQGLVYFFEIKEVPKDAMTINVLGKKWDWTFEYENGKTTVGEYTVPVNKPIKMLMRSTDVLHSFFVPAMRVKSDVIPGRYSYVSFTPVKTGTYHTFCTEYCGTNHWNMRATLHVVSESEFDAWVNDRSEELRASRETPAERGEKLYLKNCIACHNVNDQRKIGPGFQGIYNSERTFTDGTTAVADENYLKTSITNPAKQIVKGYPNQMTAFEGLLNDQQLDDLIAFMKTLDADTVAAMSAEAAEEEEISSEDLAALSPAERGERLMQEKACLACHSLDGSRLVGPSYKGLYGRKGKTTDGEEYVADDAYLKESILYPNKKIVEGYAPAMPPFEGQLDDSQLNDMIEYLKNIK